MLLERGLDPVQDVEDVVLLWPPGPEARGEVERAVLLGDERVEDVGEELHGRGPLGVVGGEDESELEDRVGVVPCTVCGARCEWSRGPTPEPRAAVRELGERTDLGGRRRRRPRP